MAEVAESESVHLDHQLGKLLLQYLDYLRRNNRECNLRFVINDKEFPCHRLVLMSVSPYIKALFNDNYEESACKVVNLNEIDCEVFEVILNALYSGNLRLLPSNAYFVLRAGYLLHIDIIVNACVFYIMRHPEVDYLVDTCIFAYKKNQKVLYSTCIQSIAKDIGRYAKVNSFIYIPFDSFKLILSNCEPSENKNDDVFLSIMKWSKGNRADPDIIHILLDTVKLKFGASLSTLTKLIASSDTTIFFDDSKTIFPKITNPDSRMDFSIYLEAVDANTGQKGWAVLKANNKFDEYILSSFHSSDVWFKQMHTCFNPESMMYILKGSNETINFSRYDIKNRRLISMQTPRRFMLHHCRGISIKGSIVYFLEEKCHEFAVWAYNSLEESWKKVRIDNSSDTEEDENENYDTDVCTDECTVGDMYEVKCDCYNYTQSAFFNDTFYVAAKDFRSNHTNILSIDCTSSLVHLVTDVPDDIDAKNSSIYFFDDKIILLKGHNYNVSHNSLLSIYDIALRKWLMVNVMLKTNIIHTCPSLHLCYQDGCIYIVSGENLSLNMMNEKYDFRSNTWNKIPRLPKRVAFENTVIVTGKVFRIEVNSEEEIDNTMD